MPYPYILPLKAPIYCLHILRRHALPPLSNCKKRLCCNICCRRQNRMLATATPRPTKTIITNRKFSFPFLFSRLLSAAVKLYIKYMMQNLFQKFQILSDKIFFRAARSAPEDAAAFPCKNIKKAAQPCEWLGGGLTVSYSTIYFFILRLLQQHRCAIGR